MVIILLPWFNKRMSNKPSYWHEREVGMTNDKTNENNNENNRLAKPVHRIRR